VSQDRRSLSQPIGNSARRPIKAGLGKEYRAAPGESLKLGLVFRDAESQELTYAQWSEPTSWLNPMRVLAVRNPKAVALGDGGFMAFVTQDDQMGGSFHDFERGFADLPTTNAPGIDPSRGISLHYSSGPLGPYVWVAYRTTDNRWIELAGTIKPSDAGVLGWEFVWPRSMKPVETDWQSAVIAGSTNGPGYAASRASASSS